MYFECLVVSSRSAEPSLHIQGNSCTSALTHTEPSDDKKSKAFVRLCDWGKSACFSFFCCPRACLEQVLCDTFQPLGLIPVLYTKALSDLTTALAHKEKVFLPEELAALPAGCGTCTVIYQGAEAVLDMQVSSGIT